MINFLSQLFSVIKQFLENYKVTTENTTVIDEVKVKNKLKKATDIAEEIFEITDRYTDSLSKEDLKVYLKLKKKFTRYN